MPKIKEEHVDRIGRPILQGSKVAVSRGNLMRICTVTKLSPKMIHCMPVNETNIYEEFYVLGRRAVVIDSEDMLSFILKGKKG